MLRIYFSGCSGVPSKTWVSAVTYSMFLSVQSVELLFMRTDAGF